MTTILLAIDPGALSGAFAVFFNDASSTVHDIPVVDRQIDGAALSRLIRDIKPPVAVVELVNSMPKQGVASMFRFGVSVGVIHGILAACGVPFHLVTPGVWKKSLGLTGKDKEAARALAIRMYPEVSGLDRKKDVGRADALLLGHYWLGHGNGQKGKLWEPGKGDTDD